MGCCCSGSLNKDYSSVGLPSWPYPLSRPIEGVCGVCLSCVCVQERSDSDREHI